LADDRSSDDATAKDLYRQVLEGIGEGTLADREDIPILDAVRIQRKLARSVVETPKTFTLAYSDVDIRRLWNLKGQDYARVRDEWRKRHFSTALSLWQFAVWAVAAVAAWYLTFNPNALRVAANPLLNDLPLLAFRVIGVMVGLGVLMTSKLAIDGITAGENWEGYIAGYEEGLRQGVNRALAITPEQEKTMWHDLKEGHRKTRH
jgi:hypothetical protein